MLITRLLLASVMSLLATSYITLAQTSFFSAKVNLGISFPLKQRYGIASNFTDFAPGIITGVDLGYTLTKNWSAKAELNYSRHNAPGFGGDQFFSTGEWWTLLLGGGYYYQIDSTLCFYLQVKGGVNQFTRDTEKFIGMTGKSALGIQYFVSKHWSVDIEPDILYHYINSPQRFYSLSLSKPNDEIFFSIKIGLSYYWQEK